MNQNTSEATTAVQMVTVDTRIYPVITVLKTAYWFTGRCFVHLQFQNEQTIAVRLKMKPNFPIQELAGEFTNHLLDQALRESLGKETKAFRNLIIAHALSNTCLIQPELESAEPFHDPLKIIQPDATAKT